MRRPIHGWMVFCTLALAASLHAQSRPSVHGAVAPYMWFSSLTGDIGIGALQTDVSLSASEVLEKLKFGMMAYGEARWYPYLLNVDAVYTEIGDGRVFAIRGDTGSFDLTQEQWIVQPVAGLTYGSRLLGLDVLGGFRYWNLSADLDVEAPRTANTRSGSRSWVDATGGFRVHVAPGWFRFDGGADGGGGGSNSTWQAYGALGATIYSHWTGALGYRWLAVNYNRDDFLYNTDMHGVTFAVGYTF